ncbi:MAG: glycosyltransferase [Solirubrobacterales bacterium]|nr:glycosyltransferase [Solirubrobacterales bacterium]
MGLSRGERALGFTSDVMVFDAHPFGYEHDIEIGLAGVSDRRGWARRFAAVARAALRYDVIHYEYGYTIAQRLHRDRLQTELPLMKRLGKTIISQWHGDDARPPSANPWGFQEPEYLAYMEAVQGPRRELMLRGSERTFFVNPDLRQWLPGGSFRPYASVDVQAIEPVPSPAGEGDEVTVIHAPSHRGIKGTEFVEKAVSDLRGEGLKVKLDLIEGLSHADAMRRFAAADLAVDQLHIGWYGGFALEVMALGKPVICHIEESEPEDNPFGDALPIVRATPDTVKEAIRGLATDRERRLALGRASREFAVAHHDPAVVAREVLDGLVPIPADL